MFYSLSGKPIADTPELFLPKVPGFDVALSQQVAEGRKPLDRIDRNLAGRAVLTTVAGFVFEIMAESINERDEMFGNP